MSPSLYDFTEVYARIERRKKQIQDIILRGNVAVFTMGNIVKKVDKWNPTEQFGDLLAFSSNGATHSVCWQAMMYELSEEVPQ